MKERPILFSGPMVRAILAGKKTQTRRVVLDGGSRGAPVKPGLVHWWRRGIEPGNEKRWVGCDGLGGVGHIQCPYGDAGDRLWVRETWAPNDPPSGFIYRADGLSEPPVWRPSIFMPRKASRLTLEVTGVRVERLQDISAVDAAEEGIPLADHHCGCEVCRTTTALCPATESSLVMAYRELWDSINGKKPGADWASNPWVWALDFRRVQS